LKELSSQNVKLEDLLQWLVQVKEVCVLLRSDDESKVKSNFDAFATACSASEIKTDLTTKLAKFAETGFVGILMKSLKLL
jgi:diketogulonate reductase-like aldo/keto reductase